MIGVSYADMEWVVCIKLRSITTDMGANSGWLVCQTFWNHGYSVSEGGPCKNLSVDPDSRLFGNALRIPGWSHTFGNLMKFACKLNPRWPEFLGHMQSLCTFYRNDSWRASIRNHFKVSRPEVQVIFKSFTARMAKWRYETAHTVMFQLNRIRVFVEENLQNIDVICWR